MNNKRILLFISLFWLTTILYAQNDPNIQKLTNTIESIINKITYEGEISRARHPNNRTVKISGSYNYGHSKYKQVIKFSKSGMKSEKYAVYSISKGSKDKIAEIVKINDKLFYIRYVDLVEEKGRLMPLYEELIVDQKYYYKRTL